MRLPWSTLWLNERSNSFLANYPIGETIQRAPDAKCGGIQRFKLGLHGAKQETAALIGYVQKGELRDWLRTINAWIRELGATLAFEEKWHLHEQLSNFAEDTVVRVAVCSSLHPGTGAVVSESICIRHLWVKMNSVKP